MSQDTAPPGAGSTEPAKTNINTATESPPEAGGLVTGGAQPDSPANDLAQRVERASAEAVAGVVTAKRRSGERGPDRKPRKPRNSFPIPRVDKGTIPLPLPEEDTPDVPPDSVAASPLVVAPETPELVAVYLEEFSGFLKQGFRIWATWLSDGDKEFVEASVKNVGWSDQKLAAMKGPGAYVATKYFGRLLKDPQELIFWSLFAGGLVPTALTAADFWPATMKKRAAKRLQPLPVQ